MDNKYGIATFANGCFWCTEAIFQRIKGVISVIPGYCGGNGDSPTYERVSTGTTGFAESLQFTFDPKIISFKRLLDIFWATHDLTTINRQGADEGSQYRSVIFYHSKDQQQFAEKSKMALEKNGTYSKKIVTEIVPFIAFYPAEEYHRDYYNRYKVLNPYCSIVIDPKIRKLLKTFAPEVKEEYKHTE